MLAGVAGGVAEILDADPSLVRVIWAILTIVTGGAAFVVYVIMAVVVPEAPAGWRSGPASTPGEPEAGSPLAADDTGSMASAQAAAGRPPASSWAPGGEARRAPRRARAGGPIDASRAGLVGGIVLIAIGVIFLIREVVPAFDWDLWWPLGLIAVGGLFLVLALLPNRPSN